MRFFLVFFALFTPLAWLLWILAGDAPPPVSLPQPNRDVKAEAVIRANEIPRMPVDGELTAFKNGQFQRFHKSLNYVELWVQIEGIERVDGRPRLHGIRCAIFGEPGGAEAKLRLTIEAPYIEGEPLALLSAREGMARELILGGGVVVRDEWGRPIATLERVIIDLDKEEVRSDDPVLFESPEKSAQLRGTGLVADLAFDSATLRSDVRARLPLGKQGSGVAVLSCKGPATLVRVPDTENYVVTLEDEARIEHKSARGDCDRITAMFRRTKGDKTEPEEKPSRKVEVEEVRLEGGVVFELDRELTQGLEGFRADSITIIGEREIVLVGGAEPVRAVRRGPMEMFGLADRVTDLDAPEIRIRLVPDAGDADDPLESIEFPRGVHLNDREGSGELRAKRLILDVAGGRLEADGGVTATSPGRKLVAERVVVSRPPDRDDVVVVGVFGDKRFELRPTGDLGPIARGALSLLVFTSTEPLYLEQFKTKAVVRTSGSVRVIGDDRELLRCDEIEVAVKDKLVQRMNASGRVAMRDPETAADIRVDRLVFDAERGNEIRLFGNPVEVTQSEHGRIHASELYYREDGSFGALGKVDIEFKLTTGKAAGTWKFLAARGEGRVDKQRRPLWLDATGDVRATGPSGERLEAESVHYESKTSVLQLKGSPAIVRQGDEMAYEGPGIDLTVLETEGNFELQGAKLVGETELVVKPKPKKGAPKNQFATWRVRLRGPAKFDGKTLRIPAGAEIKGYDEQNRLALEGEADDVTIDVVLEGKSFRPKALHARKRVVMAGYKDGKLQSKVTAKTLDFIVGSRKVEIGGGGVIERAGSEKPITIREAEFELTDDGVDLKYLSELEGELR